jgi:hypothetical protein
MVSGLKHCNLLNLSVPKSSKQGRGASQNVRIFLLDSVFSFTGLSSIFASLANMKAHILKSMHIHLWLTFNPIKSMLVCNKLFSIILFNFTKDFTLFFFSKVEVRMNMNCLKKKELQQKK